MHAHPFGKIKVHRWNIICTYLEIHLLISESYQKRQDSGEKGREEIQNMLFNIQIL